MENFNAATEDIASMDAELDSPMETQGETEVEKDRIKMIIKQIKDVNLKTSNEPETLKQLAEFLILQKENSIMELPREFMCLVAKLIQDSALGLKELLKNLNSTLRTIVTREMVNEIGTRENYGVQGIPIYRWEVNDLEGFSEELLEKITDGRQRRKELASELKEITNGISEGDLKLLIQEKGSKKISLKEKEAKMKEKEAKMREKEEKNKEKESKMKEKEKERLEKEAEKLARKVAKEEQELQKARKEEEKRRLLELKSKSQLKIQGFFNAIPKKQEVKKVEEVKSEYEATFLPFHQSKYVETCIRAAQIKNANLNFKENITKMEFKRIEVGQKLLQFKILRFYEDVRPPYFGTWSKISKVISGRRPFAQDNDLLDYEYDSEAEWEEDEPGEELKSEDDMDDDDELMECDDEDNDNDGWVVPHGYLSDDEGIDEDHANKPSKEDTTDLPKRTVLEQKVPIIVGIQYEEQPQVSNGQMLASCPIRLLGDETFIDPFKEYILESDEKKSVSRSLSRKAVFPMDLVDALSTEVLGTSASLSKLVEDFKSKYENVKKSAVEQKIRSMFVKEKRGKDAKILWHLKSSSQSTPLKERKTNMGDSLLDLSTPASSPTPVCIGAGISLDPGAMEISNCYDS